MHSGYALHSFGYIAAAAESKALRLQEHVDPIPSALVELLVCGVAEAPRLLRSSPHILVAPLF